MADCIEEKLLHEGVSLKLQTWISDVIEPGRRMYQLALVQGPEGNTLTTQFPIRTECFSEEEVRNMYDHINSKQDFQLLRQKLSEYA